MNWLSVCGKEEPALENELINSSEAALKKYNFEASSLDYISKLDRSINLAGSETDIDPRLIEKLRELCKFWDPDLSLGQISSHRKIIGPVIVGFKKILYSVLKVLLKGAFEKQRKFNAHVVELLVELAKNQSGNLRPK